MQVYDDNDTGTGASANDELIGTCDLHLDRLPPARDKTFALRLDLAMKHGSGGASGGASSGGGGGGGASMLFGESKKASGAPPRAPPLLHVTATYLPLTGGAAADDDGDDGPDVLFHQLGDKGALADDVVLQVVGAIFFVRS